MENRIAALEKQIDSLWDVIRAHAVEIAASKAITQSLMKIQQENNETLIAHLAKERLEMEAVLLNRDKEDNALPALLACFDNYLPPVLKQQVLNFRHPNPKP